MNPLKVSIAACLLLFASAVNAQTGTPSVSAPPQAAPGADQTPAQSEATMPARKDDCVGPASFCTLYFGS